MTGVPSPHPPEQLIGALIPASLPRQRPPPLPTAELPRPTSAAFAGDDRVVLSAARVDPSGRIPAAAAVVALDWPTGTHLRVDVIYRRIVLRLDQSGDTRSSGSLVAVRAKIGLPVAARRMCGIEPGSTAVLAAFVRQQLLVIHPAAEVVRLLRPTHTRMFGGRHGG